jgi:hypothetical protein
VDVFALHYEEKIQVCEKEEEYLPISFSLKRENGDFSWNAISAVIHHCCLGGIVII